MTCADFIWIELSLLIWQLSTVLPFTYFRGEQIQIYAVFFLLLRSDLDFFSFWPGSLETKIFEMIVLHTWTRSSYDECSTGDQTIILGLQIFLDHRSLSSIGQKILMILPHSSLSLPHPPFFDLSSSLEVAWMFSESYSSSFCILNFLPFCLFVFLF